MHVPHVRLSVSQLPASCSFYLAALQPLGYRYLGLQDDQVGLGIEQPSLFIHQGNPGRTGSRRAIFEVSSSDTIDSFFDAAIKAGGKACDSPAVRDSKKGQYSATVVDLDDNLVEVVYQEGRSGMSYASSAQGSKLSEQEPRSQVSRPRAHHPSPLHTVITNIVTTTTTAMKPSSPTAHEGDTGPSKALTGTLLGAAAGATIAYVMMKAESQPSPPVTPPEETRRSSVSYRYVEAPPTPRSATTTVIRRRASFDSSHAGSSPRFAHHDRGHRPRALEAPPSYYAADGLSYEPEPLCVLPAPRSAHPATASTVRTGRESETVALRSGGSRAATHRARSPPRVVRTSARTVSAAEVPPPPSARASVQRAATEGATALRSPPPAAARSEATASTVRPLTRANVERASTVGAAPAALDDLATVAPDDSISQASSKRRHKKHHHRRASDDGASRRSVAIRDVTGSAATLPVRETKREREPRSVVTALGLRGRS